MSSAGNCLIIQTVILGLSDVACAVWQLTCTCSLNEELVYWFQKSGRQKGAWLRRISSQDSGLMSRARSRSASQSVVSSSPMERRICEIVERTQSGFELQVCLLLAVQPWVSHVISLGIGLITSKMGIIILNQVLLPRSLWRSQLRAVNTNYSINVGTVYLVGFRSVPILRAQLKWFLVHLLIVRAEVFFLDTSILHLLSSEEFGYRHPLTWSPDSVSRFPLQKARRLSSGPSRYA